MAEEEKAWYVIGCLTGRDNKVFDALTAKMKNDKWKDVFFDVVQPKKTEITERELKSGKIKQIEKEINLFPGYVFVNCMMTNDLWFEIRNTPGVSGIIGSHGKGSKPTPMTTEEVEHMLRLAGRKVYETDDAEYSVGDIVIMTKPPFAGKTGKVISLERDGNITIEMEMFGKSIKVEMPIDSVEKGK